MTDHQKFGDLADAYGLGALDAAERAEFEQHLASCAECQQAVADARFVTDALPYTLTPVDPPAALRARLMTATAPPSAPAMNLRWLAVAAALVAAVAGTFAWTEYRRAGAAQVAAAQSQAQVEALQAQLTALQTQADTARRAIDILAADDLVRVDLKGQAAAPSASGRGYLSPARGLLFSAVGLPPLPEGRIYQLWYVTAAAPLSAALVDPDAAGRFTMIVNTPIGLKPTALALTIEPAGGLPAPSGAFYLLGSF
jgi:anti-sigma-K factor RskA